MNLDAFAAAALLVLHSAVVLFVVGGQLLIQLGGWWHWRWVRGRRFRWLHLGLVGFIVLQTWFGQLCPLTVWETALRERAGQQGYAESFIEHWLSRLLYIDAPWWTFVVAYTLFGLWVLLSWWSVPPHRASSHERETSSR